MQASTSRILTTHVGSLPRPQEVADLLFAQDAAKPYDRRTFDEVDRRGRRRRRCEAGRDRHRHRQRRRDEQDRLRDLHRAIGSRVRIGDTPRATPAGPRRRSRVHGKARRARRDAKYHRADLHAARSGQGSAASLETDIANLEPRVRRAAAPQAFMNAASPGVIAVFQPNELLSRPRRPISRRSPRRCGDEYEAIVAAGFVLQIDAPDLAMGRHIALPGPSTTRRVPAHRRAARRGAQPRAARTSRPSACGMHVCWGNYEGPHHHDIPLEQIARPSSSRRSRRRSCSRRPTRATRTSGACWREAAASRTTRSWCPA